MRFSGLALIIALVIPIQALGADDLLLDLKFDTQTVIAPREMMSTMASVPTTSVVNTVNMGTSVTDRFYKEDSAWYLKSGEYLEYEIPGLSQASNITVMTWLRYKLGAGDSDKVTMFLFGDNENGKMRVIGVFRDFGKIFVSYRPDYTKSLACPKEIYAKRNHEWWHVAVKFENSYVTIYVNGKPWVSKLMSLSPFKSNTFSIGRNFAGTKFSVFRLDDTRIYGRGVPDSEIWNIYEESKPPPTAMAAPGDCVYVGGEPIEMELYRLDESVSLIATLFNRIDKCPLLSLREFDGSAYSCLPFFEEGWNAISLDISTELDGFSVTAKKDGVTRQQIRNIRGTLLDDVTIEK